jgi:hypothetical protein
VSPGVLDLGSVNKSIVPAENEVYDLGTSNLRWRDLYLSGDTLFIGSIAMSVNSNTNQVSFKPVRNDTDSNNQGEDLEQDQVLATRPNDVASNAIAFWNAASNQLGFNETVVIDRDTGHVGIGTSVVDATAHLAVAGNVHLTGELDAGGLRILKDSGLDLSRTSDPSDFGYYHNTSTIQIQTSNVTGNIVFKTGETQERLRIDGSAGELQATADIVPTADATYNLGSSNARWGNLHLGGYVVNTSGTALLSNQDSVTLFTADADAWYLVTVRTASADGTYALASVTNSPDKAIGVLHGGSNLTFQFSGDDVQVASTASNQDAVDITWHAVRLM